MVIPMRVLDRKLLRDLRRMKGQVAAIGAVVAMGVMMLVMMSGLFVSLQETRRAYYERYRFADVFVPLKRAPESLLAALAAVPGVAAAEGRITGDAQIDLPGLDLPLRARALSLPNADGTCLNGVRLVAGRMPDAGNPDEILLLQSFAAARGLRPGDTIPATMNGSRRSLRIVGLAQSPEFIYISAPGEIVSNDAQYGVFWMTRKAIAAAYGLKGAFNEALLSLERNASLSAVLAAADRILDPYGGMGAYGRGEQSSNHFVEDELGQLQAMRVVMPPLFLIVAAFLLTLVVSRMVQSEREQIGLIKAFGYSDLSVGLHYFKLTVAIAVLGAAAGCILGVMAGRALAGVYLIHFKFPFLTFRLVPGPFVTGFLVSVASASAGGYFVLRRVFALTPASAMRPPAPPDYSRTGNLGRRLGERLDQPCRMVLRRLLRRPGRMAGAALGIAAAEAALKLARADRERAAADRDLAQVQLRRIRGLRRSGAASQLQLDQAEREARTTAAALHNAEAAIAVREAERKGALSRLRRFGGEGAKDAGTKGLPIHAPADGRVLRVMRESEGPVSAGTPLMETGDVENGLEVVVELLSSEAVRVSPGDRALLSGWGGDAILNGTVERIEPFAFTKVSALGVEEQRVNAIVRLTDPPEAFARLGHGFRVEVRIVVWEARDALAAPSSAVFRNGRDWAVFVVEDGTARLRAVAIGRNNGVDAQVLDGLRPGDRVVVYPSSDLTDGARVARREAR